MRYQVHKAVVVGSGTMGAALAAHLANAGVSVTLLDIVPDKLTPEEEKAGLSLTAKVVRDRIASQGLGRAQKSKPASFFSSDGFNLVKTGNLEDDFEVISKADWIIEAIVEDLTIKQSLMSRIDKSRRPEAIVSSNTSGIPLKKISAGLSKRFKQHFLGTHFFNPPRYLKLLEVIPTADTLPEVTRFISWFGEYRLGKGIVLCKDTPNFIGNRLAFGTGAFALDFILQNGYTVDEVDALTGPLMGRPKTATFRLIDLVGVDVWEHVGKNLAPAIPKDKLAQKYLSSEKSTKLIRAMVQKPWLGNKTKVGFYKEVRAEDGRKEFWSLNLTTLEHEPPKKIRFESVGRARDVENLGERLKVLLNENDKGARLVQALTYQGLQYAAHIIPEVADSPMPVDDAMRWGFGHDAGPFEIWDMLGVKQTAAAMKAAGFPPAPWVGKMLSTGIKSFYKYDKAGAKTSVYSVTENGYVPLPKMPGLIILSRVRQAKMLISENAGASLFDLDDGVACVEFHTKMNALDDDIFEILKEGLDRTEKEFVGLVVGNEAENFSAGANLFMVVVAAQQGMWETLDSAVRKLQGINMRMRYFPKPVVVAPAGLTLGGGCEVTMHASRVVAAGESYIGLVELGAGVIPAGGGTKEMVRRLVNPPMRTPNTEALPFLMRMLEQVGQAKVATSAEEARQFGILTSADRIVLNRGHLLTEANLCGRQGGAGGVAGGPPHVYSWQTNYRS
jgi:3-hydroxyacyl-CoA dehydrogenase